MTRVSPFCGAAGFGDLLGTAHWLFRALHAFAAGGWWDAASVSDPQLQVRRSFIHGHGVFTTGPLAAGDVVIDYGGELISWEEADRRHEQSAGEPGHTFLFDV